MCHTKRHQQQFVMSKHKSPITTLFCYEKNKIKETTVAGGWYDLGTFRITGRPHSNAENTIMICEQHEQQCRKENEHEKGALGNCSNVYKLICLQF